MACAGPGLVFTDSKQLDAWLKTVHQDELATTLWSGGFRSTASLKREALCNHGLDLVLVGGLVKDAEQASKCHFSGSTSILQCGSPRIALDLGALRKLAIVRYDDAGPHWLCSEQYQCQILRQTANQLL